MSTTRTRKEIIAERDELSEQLAAANETIASLSEEVEQLKANADENQTAAQEFATQKEQALADAQARVETLTCDLAAETTRADEAEAKTEAVAAKLATLKDAVAKNPAYTDAQKVDGDELPQAAFDAEADKAEAEALKAKEAAGPKAKTYREAYEAMEPGPERAEFLNTNIKLILNDVELPTEEG